MAARRYLTRSHTLRLLTLLVLLLPAIVSLPGAHASGGTVNVSYAGSLVNLNENLVGPAFAAATGYTYQGKGAGSLAIANQIKGKLMTPDVIELADPAVNATLMGPANGSYVSWYLTFARSELVVGFDPRSRYAHAFRLVQHGKLPWYRALLQRGLRFGRTDPALDPKGYRTIWMANLAQKVYRLRGFTKRLLGSDTNPSQIFPEEVLVARLLTGQIDASVFYLSEAKELGLPYMTLPPQINLGDARFAKLYATQRFTPKQGAAVVGAPIQYTISIPSTATNLDGARAFVRFVLGKRIREIAAAHGLLPLKVTVGGDRGAVPVDLMRFIGQQ